MEFTFVLVWAGFGSHHHCLPLGYCNALTHLVASHMKCLNTLKILRHTFIAQCDKIYYDCILLEYRQILKNANVLPEYVQIINSLQMCCYFYLVIRNHQTSKHILSRLDYNFSPHCESLANRS